MANSRRNAHSRWMRIIEGVRKYAAEQGNTKEALKRGMRAKSKEFAAKGAEKL